jgi:hypothetical protein
MARFSVDLDDLDFVEEFGLEENLDLHGQLDSVTVEARPSTL